MRSRLRCRIALAVLLALCGPRLPATGETRAADPLATIPDLPFEIVERRPHDRTLFTQGIAFAGDVLVESGGGYRESRLLMRRLDDPHALRTVALPRSWFAEGLAPQGERLFVLTWREGVAQSFSLPALEPGPMLAYQGEGWGSPAMARS